MITSQLKVVVLDTDPNFWTTIIKKLQKLSADFFEQEVKTTISDAISRLKEGNVDVVFLGLNGSADDGFATFSRIHTVFPDISIVSLAREEDLQLAYKIIRHGGEDYIVKKDSDNFLHAILLSLERIRLQQQCRRLANFADWNTHPIVELNTHGEIVYLNLTARGQFPDIYLKRLSHPLLEGLQHLIFDNFSKFRSEITIFNREIALNDRIYEEQLFVLPNSGVYIYVVDITERNQLRAQALLSDRLATVGTLAAGVAHEINNPIAWVLENLRYLKENMRTLKIYISNINEIMQENDVDKKLNYFDTFVKNLNLKQQETIYQFDEIINETLQGAERIRDIVRDLKGFARVDKSENSSIDVNAVLNTAINMAVPEFKYRSRLEKQFSSNLPQVLVNSGKLHQVFLNLIVNAAQAIPEGNVQGNKITITTKLEHDKVRIDIADTGTGIAADVLPRIFDPFFTTKPAGGTGLGLSIAHEVIAKFGGEIKVQSTIGEGTTFSVFLPAHFELGYQKTEEATQAMSLSGKKNVLVIDDEISLIKTMERMLEQHHKVTSVLGGKAAFDLLSNKCTDFDVIICDLNMPDINGADLYHYVTSNFPGREYHFIFISAGVYTATMKDFMASIENPLIEKPFTPQDLLSAIDKIMLGTAKAL